MPFLARDLLLAGGLLLSPAVAWTQASAWGFFIEHLESLSPVAGRLRLVDEAAFWDFRLRQLFAERVAVALAGLAAWRHLGVLHIADAAPFLIGPHLDPASPYYRVQLHRLATADELKPDFLCLDRRQEAIVLESKGTVGAPSALKAEKKRGKDQVSAVTVSGVSLRSDGGRLVAATNLRYVGEKVRRGKDSTCEVVDPAKRDNDAWVLEATPDRIVVHAYAKVFSWLGLASTALALIRGRRPAVAADALLDERRQIGQLSLIQLAHQGDWFVALPEDIARRLLLEPIEGLFADTAPMLDAFAAVSPDALQPHPHLTSFSNGLVVGFTSPPADRIEQHMRRKLNI